MIPNQLQPLANHLWHSTLFAIVACLLTLALRKNRAQTRYWLYLAASVKFLIPFSLLVDLGNHLGWQASPAIAPTGLSYVIDQVSQPFFLPTSLTTTMAGRPSSPVDWIPALLYAIWAIGFVLLIVSWMRRWRGLRAALRTAFPLDLEIGMRAMVSPAFVEPGVFGLRRPVLLLPAETADRLTPPQLSAIVAHELCHIHRHDNLISALHMAVEALFWFHPLVWWLGARLMEERERACDEHVLLMGVEPETYAEAILTICEMCLDSRLPCISGMSGGNLKNRIETIMRNRIPARVNPAKNALFAAAGAAALALPIVVGMISTATVRAQPAPPQSGAAIDVQPSGPKFEVASIRPSPRPTQHVGIVADPARVDIGNWSILQLIVKAYKIQAYQLIGPEWMGSERFDIQATLPQGSDQKEVPEMLQRLLAERFGLAVHVNAKELRGFRLTLGKGGLKMKAAEPDSVAKQDEINILDELWGSGKAFGSTINLLPNGDLHVEFQKMPMPALAQFLSSDLRAPVTDLTGLEGKYHVTLEFDPVSVTNSPVAGKAASRDLFAAVRQLGLKLERQSVRCNVLIVDRVDRIPTAN